MRLCWDDFRIDRFTFTVADLLCGEKRNLIYMSVGLTGIVMLTLPATTRSMYTYTVAGLFLSVTDP